ncbi:MAG: DUF3999 domain-containing protein [Deltaproteobacteria bacterium]|nr:DUF3999 domain-containing protein [Deltaproteobacteria bacterium]
MSTGSPTLRSRRRMRAGVRRALLLTLLVGLGASTFASADPTDPAERDREPRLEDFAEAIDLAPREARAVHTVLIPIEVYRGVTRPDLGDLRVFDARGQLVPHALRALDAPGDREPSPVDLRFFPIMSPATPTGLEDLTLHVVRDGSGTVVEVRSRSSAVDGSRRQAGDGLPTESGSIGAYVLDTAELAHPLTALRFELAPSEGDYVLPLTVETSDDLTRFASVGSPRSLVRLTYAGEQILQDRVELPAVRARYVVLRWGTARLPAPLVRVTGELLGERESAELVVHRLSGRRHADDPQRIDFDLGGFVPVERVRVALTEENALVAAELLAGPRVDGPLATVERGTIYRVATGGQTLESPAIGIARRIDRFWAVRAQTKGGGFGATLPELEIAYHPQQLLFLARGQAPFILAFGRHDAQPSTFAWQELLGFLPESERAALPRSDVDASPPRILSGEAARVPPPPPLPPLPLRRYVLWSVLVLGVGALAIAAWRLVRDVRD